ncbi:MAG: DNA packaging protein, partial [Desulfobulbia bacterium]
VLVAWDRDTDTAYLIDTYKGSKGDVLSVHASRIKKWGDWTPVVWPHDAGMKDRTTGKSFKQLLRAEGLKMTKEHAQLPDGGISVEAGIMAVQQRLRDGRFRVFRHLEDFLREYRTYHRDQTGRIVKQRDHTLDASRYALVSLRMGRVKAIVRQLDYSRMPAVY